MNDHLGQALGGDRGEQNAVAVMAGGVEEPGDGGIRPEDGPAVFRAGAQACPNLEDRLTTERWDNLLAEREDGGHALGGDAAIVAHPLHCRAGDEVSPKPGHKVASRRVDDVPKRDRGHFEGDHLPTDGLDAVGRGKPFEQLTTPGACREQDVGGLNYAPIGLDPGDAGLSRRTIEEESTDRRLDHHLDPGTPRRQ